MVLRILMLIACTLLLTYTTSPILLTDGLERLLRPLKKVRFPVHELSMMMSIALRFIPTLIQETDKIISAQKARGADFDSGNLMQKAKALIDLADNWLMLVRLELTVFADNERAVHLYESLGFEREGIRRKAAVRNGVYMDEIAMARIRE